MVAKRPDEVETYNIGGYQNMETIQELFSMNPGVVVALVAFFIMVLIAIIAAIIAAISTASVETRDGEGEKE